MKSNYPKDKCKFNIYSVLGGFLGRKRNGEPGPNYSLWMRFCDLSKGWNLASERAISCNSQGLDRGGTL